MDTIAVEKNAVLSHFKEYLKSRGLAFTPQRREIIRFVSTHRGHFTVDTLIVSLRGNNIVASRATVYRTVAHLHAAGFLREIAIDNMQARYEYVAGVKHHEHMVCESCGQILEFVDPVFEKEIEAIARKHDIVMTRHTVQIFGVCSACRKAGERGVPVELQKGNQSDL